MVRIGQIIVGAAFICAAAGAAPVFMPPGTLSDIGHYLEQKRLAMRSHLPDMPDFTHDPAMAPKSDDEPAGQGAFLGEIAAADAPAEQPSAKPPECADRGPRFQSVIPGEGCGSEGGLKHGKQPPARQTAGAGR